MNSYRVDSIILVEGYTRRVLNSCQPATRRVGSLEVTDHWHLPVEPRPGLQISITDTDGEIEIYKVLQVTCHWGRMSAD